MPLNSITCRGNSTNPTNKNPSKSNTPQPVKLHTLPNIFTFIPVQIELPPRRSAQSSPCLAGTCQRPWGKRGPEGKRACRRHDMLQDFCKLRQRKSKGIHCETHHQQPWHSVSRNGPVCHTDWLWNGGNLGASIQDTHGYTMSPSYTPIHTPTYYNLHLASVDSFTPLNRWGGIAAMNRCTMSDCPVHHFMWGTHEQ